MTTTNSQSGFKKLLLAATVLLLAIGIGLFIASERLDTYQTALQIQIAEQQAALVTIAEIIARNGADSVTESVVRDCAGDDRARFDALLGRLDSGLPQAELAELEVLFGACASFYADRKALMVARFERELGVYQQQLALLDSVTTGDAQADAAIASWEELVQQEQAQSESFTQLVTAQKQIIDALLAGKSSASPEITAILESVLEIKEAQLFARQKAQTLRDSLTSL